MLRVDDQLELSYRLTRETDSKPYRLTPGDIVHVESTSNANYEKKRELAEFVDGVVRNLEVQPDGTITLPLIGRVPAAGRTTDELRHDLDRRFKKFYKDPSITVTPIKVNSRLEDLRAVVDSRQGLVGGQAIRVVVAPDGTIQLPGIGSVPAQGLMLDELKREIDARYAELLNGHGIEVTPVLSQRAPRFIYVLGEVTNSGRFDMVGPTNVMQAIALAGGWQNGGNLRHIIVFRRADDWRLMATKIDIRGSLYGKRPIPTDNIWLRDSDVVLVTKQPIKTVADGIDLIFTQGIYAVLPILGDANLFVDGNN
jgi:polysaccharide export outer membrane protein